MTAFSSSPLAHQPPLRALFGLSNGDDSDLWGRIRAAQLLAARQRALLLLAANLTGTALIVMTLNACVPVTWLAIWALVAGAVAVGATVRRLRSSDRPGGYADLGAMRPPVIEAAALALVWSVVPVMFGGHLHVTTALATHLVLAVLMVVYAVAMVSLPLVTITFIATTTTTAAVTLLVTGHPAAALADLLFAALLCVSAVDRARAQALLHAAAVTLAERDGTIGLLLRDFDETSPDWLWQTDASRRIVEPSARFAAACGVERDQLAGRPLLEVLAGTGWDSGQVAPVLRDLVTRLRNREAIRDLNLPVMVGGEQRWWRIAASPRRDANGHFGGFRGVASDVTEERASADKIARLARFDTLTGLPNRLSVNEALADAVATAERERARCALMMIDLDRFKAVNDRYGHSVGDAVLAAFCHIAAPLLPPEAVFGRMGGEEFACLLPRLDERAASRVGERVRAAVARFDHPDYPDLAMRVSVGVAAESQIGGSLDYLLRRADEALYRAKHAGRDRVVTAGDDPLPRAGAAPETGLRAGAGRRSRMRSP